MNELTPKQERALRILRDNPGVTMTRFSYLYYEGTPQEYLLYAVSNQGNGACAGKKAWLCAGSYLAKLCKKGLLVKNYDRNYRPRYTVSDKGERLLDKLDKKTNHATD